MRSHLPATLAAAAVALACFTGADAAGQKFFRDDPLAREPETMDASGAAPSDIDLIYDLAYNLAVTARRAPSNSRAQNVNTIDEVPDSGWFTNRIGARAMTIDEVRRGPVAGPAPAASKWTVVRGKSSGDAVGFTATDANGETFFISFDAPPNPDGATGALVIATKIFWALGYHQVEYFLTSIKPDAIAIASTATVLRPSGRRTPMTLDDVHEELEGANRSADGSYRAAAGRLLPGKVLGGFKYEGTRPDDPNDVVPHQHRRELRALRVFGAWTNLTDMKAGNTLDTLLTEGGRSVIRHYLQDVGSTFGVGANGPHDWNEGWEYVIDGPGTKRRFYTFGFAPSPWQTADLEKHPSVGRFTADNFDPDTWKPRVPTRAYLEMRDDDAFWAARRVMAFSDEMIRAVVKTGGFSDPEAERYLADVLIKRRDIIGRTYLTRLTPVVEPALDAAGTLRFGNAAVDHEFASAPAAYAAKWFTFDNATGESTPIGDTSGAGTTLQAPAGLPTAASSYIRVEIAATHADYPHWKQPVQTYFRRDGSGWKLVGLERMPANR